MTSEEQQYNILLVEDEPGEIRMLKRCLEFYYSSKFYIVYADSLKLATKQISQNDDLDLIILDLNLGDSKGLDTFNAIHKLQPKLPVLILSGIDDEELAIETVKHGAQDYLVKGKDDANSIGRAICFAIERKRIEKEKARLQALLNQERRLEAIGVLASGIAHEINSPIQFITSNTFFISKSLETFWDFMDRTMERGLASASAKEEYLELLPLQDSINDAMSEIAEGLKRVKSIVKAMNIFSRRSNKKLIPYDLNSIIEDSIVITRNEWKYVANLETNLDKTLPPLVCLPEEISQALLNILINAADAVKEKASLEASSMLEIISITTFQDNGNLEIRITDTGKGIPKDIEQRVFEPFFTTKDIGKGSGQGLNLAYSIIVKQHQGKLSFESIHNQGTVFKVSLPIKPPVNKEEDHTHK